MFFCLSAVRGRGLAFCKESVNKVSNTDIHLYVGHGLHVFAVSLPSAEMDGLPDVFRFKEPTGSLFRQRCCAGHPGPGGK